MIGHVATRWAFDPMINGVSLQELVDADFGWREGWEYRLGQLSPVADRRAVLPAEDEEKPWVSRSGRRLRPERSATQIAGVLDGRVLATIGSAGSCSQGPP